MIIKGKIGLLLIFPKIRKGLKMFTTRRNKIFYFCLFLFPALLLYGIFFINPLLQGIKYSFTDWNGIVPPIPLSMEKNDFQSKVLGKLKDREDKDYILKYYKLDESDSYYRLTNWIEEKTGLRKIAEQERDRIKIILKSVGITPINNIGFANFKEMLSDKRFIPGFEKRYLFNEFDPLPKSISVHEFKNNLLDNIKKESDKEHVLTYYQLDENSSSYILTDKEMTFDNEDRLRIILSDNMYKMKLRMGVIGFTLFFTLFNVVLTNLLALILALILDNKMKLRNTLRSMFFLPNVISLVIVAYIWSFMFRLIFPKITGIYVWLGNPDLAKYAVLMVNVWQGCGYLMIIYLAGLQTIPAELIEAAKVDGARWFKQLFKIKFPLLLPSFTICLFYSLANSLKQFDAIWALTGGGPGYSTSTIVIDIYKNAFEQNRYGYATAKALLLCLMIIIITGIQLYYMKRKEVEL